MRHIRGATRKVPGLRRSLAQQDTEEQAARKFPEMEKRGKRFFMLHGIDFIHVKGGGYKPWDVVKPSEIG